MVWQFGVGRSKQVAFHDFPDRESQQIVLRCRPSVLELSSEWWGFVGAVQRKGRIRAEPAVASWASLVSRTKHFPRHPQAFPSQPLPISGIACHSAGLYLPHHETCVHVTLYRCAERNREAAAATATSCQLVVPPQSPGLSCNDSRHKTGNPTCKCGTQALRIELL
jgi:hypothetical protein